MKLVGRRKPAVPVFEAIPQFDVDMKKTAKKILACPIRKA